MYTLKNQLLWALTLIKKQTDMTLVRVERDKCTFKINKWPPALEVQKSERILYYCEKTPFLTKYLATIFLLPSHGQLLLMQHSQKAFGHNGEPLLRIGVRQAMQNGSIVLSGRYFVIFIITKGMVSDLHYNT